MDETHSPAQQAFEFWAVILTIVGKFILAELLDWGLSYVIGACLFWIVYVIVRSARTPGVFDRWGFARVRVGAGILFVAPFAAVTLGGFVLFGLLTGRAAANSRTLILLVAYPVWGLVQQFLTVVMFADNVRDLGRERLPPWAIILAAAILFSLVHIPVLPLMGATFVLGLMTTTAFFRTRSLWPLGVLHGWYATLFYVYVMGEDPLGALLHV